MAKRAEIEGTIGWIGACRECSGILFVSDKSADGSFITFHTDPLCSFYIDQCKGREELPFKARTIEIKSN